MWNRAALRTIVGFAVTLQLVGCCCLDNREIIEKNVDKRPVAGYWDLYDSTACTGTPATDTCHFKDFTITHIANGGNFKVNLHGVTIPSTNFNMNLELDSSAITSPEKCKLNGQPQATGVLFESVTKPKLHDGKEHFIKMWVFNESRNACLLVTTDASGDDHEGVIHTHNPN